MKRRRAKKRQSWLIDGILLCISAGLFISSIYFLVSDDGSVISTHSLEAVGQFKQSRNDVRRKIRSGFLWSQISRHEPVYEGDSIFTGDDSDASIEIEKGGTIHLSPKSLVVIRTQDGLFLDLKYGSMVGKINNGDKPLVISQNGERRELAGDDAEFRIESSEGSHETKIHVVKGQIAIKNLSPHNKEAAPQVVHVDETADLKAEAAPVILKTGIKLISPANGKSIWLKDDQKIDFVWRPTGDTSRALKSVIEFSRDDSFGKLILQSTVDGNTFSLAPGQRPKGEFHWRVHLKDTSDSEPSTAFSLTAYPDSPPVLVIPHDRQNFTFNRDSGETGKEVSLAWQDDAGSSTFDLQVASTPGFESPLINIHSVRTSEKTNALTVGSYYWRVRGLNRDRNDSPWSTRGSFSVGEEITHLPTPEIKQTRIDFEVPRDVLDKAPPGVSMTGTGVRSVTVTPLTWSAVSGANDYEVEVSKKPDFSKSTIIKTAGKLTYAPPEVKPGPMYMRVKALGPKDASSDVSSLGVLQVSDAPPALKVEPPTEEHFKDNETLMQSRHEFDLNWSRDPFAESYQVDWGLDEDFKVSKTFEVPSPDYKITVSKTAKYKARVRPLGHDKQPVGPYSTVQTYSYKKILDPPPVKLPVAAAPAQAPAPLTSPPGLARAPTSAPGLPSPVLTEPLRDASVVSLEDSVSFVNLKWHKVSGAETYEVQVAQDADFVHVIDSTKIKINAYTVSKPLPEGKVFWRVRASRKKLTSDWSEVNRVIVLYN